MAGGDADAEVLALLAAHLDAVVERAASGARAGSSQPVSARRACAARDWRLPCTPHKRALELVLLPAAPGCAGSPRQRV